MKVVVVGAGIIGASIAWHVARAGARVTVIDAGEPGGVATRQSLAWINASRGNRPDYFRLRLQAMEDWRRLERDLPTVRVGWVGGLLWDLPADRLEAFAAEHEAWGYGIRRVDRVEAQRIEPQLAVPPDFAVHVAAEGAVEPLDAALTLLAAAQALGAAVIGGTAVRSLSLKAGRVTGIVTDRGDISADMVVVAAGVGAPGLMDSAGIALPVAARPNLFIVTTPQPRLLNGLVLAPQMHVRQTHDGRLAAAAGSDERDPAEAAQGLLGALRGMLRSIETLSLDAHGLAQRPIPEDGHPIVCAAAGVDGLYVAVAHSGVTLAAALGRFVAQEIMGGERAALLAPYTLDRFVRAAAT